MIGWKPKFNDSTVASVRYRCLNPLIELQRRGFPVELYNEEKTDRYSGVIFSKLYDDKNYAIAKRFKDRGAKVIFDICDNHFYNPNHLEKFKIVRQQLLRMLAIADSVVTSTEMLANVLIYEAQLPSPPVVIGDAIEQITPEAVKRSWFQKLMPRKKRIFENAKETGKTDILWFGIHGGENAPYGMLDLLHLKELLIRISKDFSIRLNVVSNSREKYEKHIRPFPFETCYYEWNMESFGEILKQNDINIIPISKNPFTLCKSNNRLATALYAGVPTVADEIPSYKDLSPFCVLDDWEYGIRLYLEEKGASAEHVSRARAYINDRYTIKQMGDQWVNHLSRFV